MALISMPRLPRVLRKVKKAVVRRRVLLLALTVTVMVAMVVVATTDAGSWSGKSANTVFSWTPVTNATEEKRPCRNTVQGRTHVTDDQGYVCARENVRADGCCVRSANTTALHSCAGCTDAGCCRQFENCVSCCLDPRRQSFLEVLLRSARDLVLLSVRDPFELCVAACRTSSKSVVHENSYRDALRPYCYDHKALT